MEYLVIDIVILLAENEVLVRDNVILLVEM